MVEKDKVRVDKWLFAMRLFKTRGLATDFCDRERVAVGEGIVKPSRMVKTGDHITLLKTGYKLIFEVIKLTSVRLPAKLVQEFCRDITPKQEKDKLDLLRMQKINENREKGSGRPTKRLRRALDDFSQDH